jgi:hypothetical protein
VTPETVFKRKAEMMVADMDGELVMMDVDQGTYFAINPVGSHIWTLLETPQSMTHLTASVLHAFKTEDTEQVSADVERFLSDLSANNLIDEVTT